MKTPAAPLLRAVLVGVLIVAAGTVTAQPAAAGRLIEVTAEGVTFDSDAENATVEYWITDPKGNGLGYYSRSLSRHDTDGGYAAFTEAASAYPGAYCVAAVRVERAGDWAAWSNGIKGYKCAQSAPSPTPTTESPSPTPPPSAAAPPPAPTSPPPAAPTTQPANTSPTPTPSPSPSPTPTPSPEVSLSPLPPVPEPEAQDPLVAGRAEADGGGPLVDDIGGSGPTGLGWLAALAGGLLAAAGGGLVLLNRRPR
ncbi:hypothetical protein L1785_00945 [Antribacter sp. KLBMP9083]|uniref:Gram-positive cocci surface proteins LPxTG domain-containing protein n=1 Tax=Antribacter soli TaxID=2910976 RepID=A0AA41QCB9_9MICO|nr:hypothetical protein [Antribacter soli]MCF4119544.1 hypothetical protein [Antribacter soli]